MIFDELRLLRLEKQVKDLFTKYCCCTDTGGGSGGGIISVFGRTTPAILAIAGDYTTALVTEATNLYFTNARARAAISLTTTGSSGPATYNSSTGVLNVPQYTGGGSGEANTGANLGSSGSSVYASKIGVVLQFRKIVGGSGISVTENTNDITIVNTQTPGEVNTSSNLVPSGTIARVYKQKTGVNFEFRPLVQGTGIVLTENTDGIVIDASGVSPTLKTINTATLLGSGDISLQVPLVSGTNIKTVNSTTLLGIGDLAVQPTLVSGTNIKTVNSVSLLGSGNVAVQDVLVSGTNIKTVGGTSILGSGDIPFPAGSDITVVSTTTNNTPIVVATITPTAASSEIIEIEVLTYSKLTTGVGGHLSKKYNVYEFNAGVLTELDAGIGTVDLIADRYSTTLSTCSTTLAIVSNTIQIQFTGESAKTIKNSFTYSVKRTTF